MIEGASNHSKKHGGRRNGRSVRWKRVFVFLGCAVLAALLACVIRRVPSLVPNFVPNLPHLTRNP